MPMEEVPDLGCLTIGGSLGVGHGRKYELDTTNGFKFSFKQSINGIMPGVNITWKPPKEDSDD